MMFDKIFKVVIIVLFTIFLFLMWTTVDTDTDEYDDPNKVTIEYECDKLNQYETVPDEVAQECKDRNKE